MTRTPAIEALVKLLPDLEVSLKILENGYNTNTFEKKSIRIIIAAVKELAARDETHVWVPKEPTMEMLHACQAAMKNYIRSLSPEDRKALGWKGGDTSKYGYRIKPYEKAKLRYKAMIGAAP